MSDEVTRPFTVLEQRIEDHHAENKTRFAHVEERVRLLEVSGAAAHERGEASYRLLEEIKRKLEAPRWWIIAGIVFLVGGLIFQAGRYPDRDELRGVASRLMQVEVEQRMQRMLLDAAAGHKPSP